jgi:tetratricopeptide (TPR) repeat protein
MIELSRLTPAACCAGSHFRKALALAAVALALLGVRAAQAQNQMTTQMLIGDSVSEIGNRYSDVEEAIKRFVNRDVLAARQFLETAKKKDANLPPVDLLLAKMYFLGGNPNAGRAALEKTAAENPDDPEAYLILADQAMAQGRLIEADALYERGLAVATKYAGNAKRKRNSDLRARRGRAQLAARRKNWDAAVADLKALVQSDPESAGTHYQLGQALFMQKQFQDGIKELTEAKRLDKDKNLPDPNVAAAQLFDVLKDSAKAQQAFERALAGAKNDPNVISAYSQWLIRNGTSESLAKSEAMLQEARRANAGNLNLLILSGVNARMLKKMKPAEDYFVEAHGVAPGNIDVINQLALLLIEQPDQSKQERALQFAGIGAQLNNQNADAQMTLSWVLYKLQRLQDADTAFRNALQLGGNLSPDSSYLVAQMLKEQSKTDAARQILQQALEQEYPGIFVYKKDAQALLDSLPKQ